MTTSYTHGHSLQISHCTLCSPYVCACLRIERDITIYYKYYTLLVDVPFKKNTCSIHFDTYTHTPTHTQTSIYLSIFLSFYVYIYIYTPVCATPHKDLLKSLKRTLSHGKSGYAKWYTATYPNDLNSFAANASDPPSVAKQKALRRQQPLGSEQM